MAPKGITCDEYRKHYVDAGLRQHSRRFSTSFPRTQEIGSRDAVKTIVAGSRVGITRNQVFAVLNLVWQAEHPVEVTSVVSGAARGVDTWGEEWAAALNIPVHRMPADWDAHGKAAGVLRNKQMAEIADALILIWDGSSSGSKNMLAEMRALKKPVFEIVIRQFDIPLPPPCV